MKTSELIAALATQPAPAQRHVLARRLTPPLLVGVAAAFVLLVLVLGLRPLDVAVVSAPFWMKAAYTASIAAVALLLVARTARPGGEPGQLVWWAAAPVAVMVVLGLMELSAVRPEARLDAWLGFSWKICMKYILMLAAPIFVAAAFALRRLAPTRLALAGACAGLFAGAVGATLYGLFCRETSPAFVATWYTLGIALCAALGALAGPRLLRW